MKKKGETFLPEPFELTPATLAWQERKYPQIDTEATLEKFCRKAGAEGWMYRDWQRGYQGIIEKGMESGWRSIVTIKGGVDFDPKWLSVLQEARKYGFREPLKVETPSVYRTAFEMWKREPKQNLHNVLDLRGVLKKVV